MALLVASPCASNIITIANRLVGARAAVDLMTAQIVPVIYDHATKKILRWYLLDFDRQLSDAAFKPRGNNERVLMVPLQLYKALAGTDATRPLQHKLQDYVNGNAP